MNILYFVIVLITFTLLTGCFASTNKGDCDKDTINKAKEKVESYIRNNYGDIESVEFDDSDYSSPMGGLVIRGTVNEKAGFPSDIDSETFWVQSLGEKEEFPERKE